MLLADQGVRLVGSGSGLLEVEPATYQKILIVEDIYDLYEVESYPFARGKFGTVRRIENKRTGTKYAAKFLRRRRRAQCNIAEISHEIAVLILCAESEHIVKLHGVHETKNEIALVLELATGGELQTLLDEEGYLSEDQVRICMQNILAALQHMHRKKIAHLDLKPQNILLAGKTLNDGLKLCDFGISRIVEEGGRIREILGTPDYVAPEVLQFENLSLSTDIWSIGVLTYVLLSGCSPFGGDNKQETFLNISQCSLTFPEELFGSVSTAAIDFIKSTLRIRPNDRLTVSECLKHRWLADDSPKSSSILLSSSFSNAKLSDFDLTAANATPAADHDDHNLLHTYHNGKGAHSIADGQREGGEEEENNKNNKNMCSVNGSSVSIYSSSPHSSPASNKCYKNNISIQIDDKKSRIIMTGQDTMTTTTTNNEPLMKTTSVVIFPDAPTTPKVIRKCSPDASATHKVSCEFMPATTRNLNDLIVAAGENIVTVNDNANQNSVTIMLSASSTSLNTSSSTAGTPHTASPCNNNLLFNKGSIRTSNFPTTKTSFTIRQPATATTTNTSTAILSSSSIHLIDVDLKKLNSS